MPSLRPTVVTILALLLAPLALAQFPSAVNNDTRTPVPGSGHDYIKMLTETVDPSNGSLSVHISTPVPPSRGITIPFSFDYSSGAVKVAQVCSTSGSSAYGCWAVPNMAGVVPESGGWSYRIPELTANQTQAICHTTSGTLTTDVVFDYIFTDPSGMQHNLGLAHTPTLQPNCSYVWNPEPYSVSTGGDDFYGATLNQTTGAVTVVGSDGTVYNFTANTFGGGFLVTGWLPSAIEDRNGNIVTISQGSGGKITETDTAGRSSVSTSAPVGTNGTVSISGLPNVYTVTWETISSVYGSQYEQLGNGSNDGCNWTGNGGGNITVIKSIELPNGTFYTFAYDSYGLLSQISYPTGAVVNYTRAIPSSPNGQIAFFPPYPNNQFGCEYAYYAPMVTQRTVKSDGVHTALVQNFSYTTAYNAGVEQATVQTTVYSSDGSTNLGTFKTVYNYAPGFFGVSDPDDQVVVASPIPVEQTVQHYDYGQTNLLETVTKGWQDQFLLGCQLETHDGSGLRGTFYSYGAGGVVTDKKEYDYGKISGTSQCPQAAEGGPITAPSSPTRETAATYQVFAKTPIYPTPSILDRPCSIITKDSSGNKAAETDYLYDNGTAVCGTAGTPSVATANSPVQHDTAYAYNASPEPPRGNLTSMIQQCIQAAPACSSGNPTTIYTNDETGQVLSAMDPNGNTTGFGYADSYTSGTPPGNTNAYLTKITGPEANGVNHISTFSYGYADGQPTKSVDENNQPTTYTYNTPPSGCADGLDRLGSITYPDTGLTTYCYNDTAPTPTVTTKRLMSSGNNLTSVTTMDGLGHVTESNVTSDGNNATVTVYDGLGRVFKRYNPTRCSPPTTNCGESTWGLTTFAYDALGRTLTVTNPDNSTVSASYAGRATKVTDESGKQRISQTDGLGRLPSVCEVTSTTLTVGISGSTTPAACGLDISATGFLTSYTYDALDDLTSVAQGPLNPRSFTYNSLGQLTIGTNPESGTTCYGTLSGTNCQQNGYDANGNVTIKTDARGTKITYSYDALNRLTQKSYSDGTPTVQFGYDQSSVTLNTTQATLANPIGRLTSEKTFDSTYNPSSMSAFSYDPMGRINHMWECQNVGCSASVLDVIYGYDLIGDETDRNLTGSDYASTYDGGAHLTSFTHTTYSDSTNPPNLLSGGLYDPFGHIIYATYGSGISESSKYDDRSRLVAKAAGTGCTSGSGTCTTTKYSVSLTYFANGNVQTANDTANGNWTYTYDDFNRLATSASGSNSYAYAYDRFGNRWNQTFNGACTAGTTACMAFDANNHMTNGTQTYDAAGNVLSDAAHHYGWDAESRLNSLDNGATTYYYDAEGRRLEKKTNGTVARDWYYNRDSTVMIEIAPPYPLYQEEYAGGMHIATLTLNSAHNDTDTYFHHNDWLGTERARSNWAGTLCETIASLPFGDGMAESTTCADGDVSAMHFTGKERDLESGLDYFGARHHGSGLGRFMSPDSPSYSNHKNPQSWNLYAFDLNNPVTFRDSDGHKVECTNNVEQCKKDAAKATGANVQVQTVQDKPNWFQRLFHMQGTTHNYLTVQGDTSGFAPGSNAAKLAALIADPHTVTVTYDRYAHVSVNFDMDTRGGSTSLLPSQKYTSDARAWIDPANQDYPGSGPRDPDAVEQGIPEPNTAEEFGHELLGHIWGELINGDPAGTRRNMRDSIIGENAVRALDPTRGQKGLESHHSYWDPDTKD